MRNPPPMAEYKYAYLRVTSTPKIYHILMFLPLPISTLSIPTWLKPNSTQLTRNRKSLAPSGQCTLVRCLCDVTTIHQERNTNQPTNRHQPHVCQKLPQNQLPAKTRFANSVNSPQWGLCSFPFQFYIFIANYFYIYC